MTRPSVRIGVTAAAAIACMAAGKTVSAQMTGRQPAPAKQAVGAATGKASTAGWEQIIAEFGGTAAATRASQDAQMTFSFSTEVVEINARGGQRVKKGDLLLRARDSEVKTAIDQQKALAESDLEVQGAEKELELANLTYKNLKDSGGFSKQEIDQRRIEAETALIKRDVAKFNREQQRLRLAQLEAQYERYRLLAPFDGIIDEVMVELGQGVTEQDKVLRIVNIDKMWLDPTPKTAETITLDLKPGSKAWVLIDLPGKPVVYEGKVIEVSPVADPVSLTRRVRVEIENPKGLPPGTQAMVRFSPPEGGEGKWVMAASAAPAPTLEEVLRVFDEMSTPAPARLTEAELIRQVVAEALADAESRGFVVPGDGAHQAYSILNYGPRYIPVFPKTDGEPEQ